jgi:GxxExxY protein
MALEEEELTGSILGAAIAVHRALGPGFIESVYSEALAVELTAREIEYQREVSVPVVYREVVVGTHRVDLLVQGRIVVELKATKEIAEVHFSVVRSYLKALGLRHGLIVNFAKPTLEPKRVLVPAFLPSSAANPCVPPPHS